MEVHSVVGTNKISVLVLLNSRGHLGGQGGCCRSSQASLFQMMHKSVLPHLDWTQESLTIRINEFCVPPEYSASSG